MPHICLSTPNTLNYPQGGHLWVFINWALGFRACGCDVSWLDVVSPSTSAEEVQATTERLRQTLRPFGLDNTVLVGHLTEEPTSFDDDIGPFDLLFDLRYNLPHRLRERARRSALLDIDPGQLQIALASGVYPDPGHDFFFTIGSAGTSLARFPDAGKKWLYIPPCIYLPEWPKYPTPPQAAWTTMAHWWNESWMIDEKGVWFPNEKRAAFEPLMNIPAKVNAPFVLALDSIDKSETTRVQNHGFKVVDAYVVGATPIDYRRFIQQSYGEFSTAKPSYVRLKTSWISDRTICYLASGKPCVVEDTGPIQNLKLENFGAGLHRFTSPEEAIRAVKRVMANYEDECTVARQIAEECFDARQICKRVLSLTL
jgi:hypothetical protein